MLEILRLNNRLHFGVLLAFIDLNRLGSSYGADHCVQVLKGPAAVLKPQQGSATPQPEQRLLVNSRAGNRMVGNERPVPAKIHELPVTAVELKLGMKTRDRRIRNHHIVAIGAANANRPLCFKEPSLNGMTGVWIYQVQRNGFRQSVRDHRDSPPRVRVGCSSEQKLGFRRISLRRLASELFGVEQIWREFRKFKK